MTFMKKSIRSLAVLAILCIAGAAVAFSAPASAATEARLAVGMGQTNYINNIETRSVCVEGDRMIVCDFGVYDPGGNQRNGALYFYEQGELTDVYRPESGNFNPKKAVFRTDGTVCCLSNGQLLSIDVSEGTFSEIFSGTGDFQFVGDRLFALVVDSADPETYHIREYADGDFTTDLYTVINPLLSFATDGESFWFYGQKSTAESAKLYRNDQEIPFAPGTPSKLALCNGRLLALCGSRLYAVGETEAAVLGDQPASSFEVGGEVVYLISNNRIEGFTIREDKLVSADFLFSKAGSARLPGNISAPLDMAGGWILDGDFASLVGEEKVFSLSGISGPGGQDAQDAFAIAATGDLVCLACPTGIFRFNTANEETAFLSLGEVTDIALSAGGELYAAAGGKLWKAEPDADAFTLFRDFEAEAIEVSNRNNRLYALKGGKITVFGETEETLAADLAGATDFAIDFKNQVFALCGGTVKRVSQEGEVTEELDLLRPGILDTYGTAFAGICLDEQTGEIFIPDTGLSLVFVLSKDQSGTALSSEIPSLTSDVDPLDRTLGASCGRARVGGFPSTLLYPSVAGGSEGSFYPTDPAGTITELAAGTEVLVLDDSVRDSVGNYYFVCVRLGGTLAFGYLIDTNLTPVAAAEAPFESGHTAFATEIYKYPDTDTRFLCRTLDSDTSLTVLNVPAEGWLQVDLGNGETGFVRRSAVIEKIYTGIDDRVNAFTVGIGGSSPLYREASLESEVIAEIPDDRRVKIISRSGAFVYVETEDHLFGYMESRFLVEEGFSNAQKIGIILLVSCAVLGALTILIRKKIIH